MAVSASRAVPNSGELNTSLRDVEGSMTYLPETSSISRRVYPRVLAEPRRPLLVDVHAEHFVDVLKARDISERGAGLYLAPGQHRLAVGDVVSLVINLPAPVNVSVSVGGCVRHRQADFFGVEFLGLRPADQRVLRRYVTYRLADNSWLTPVKGWWAALRGC